MSIKDETMWTTCYRCNRMKIEIVEDSAPEFCEECCICGNCTADGFDHERCFEEASVEWRDITT